MAELTDDELAELARAPKTTSVDGQLVTERDAADVLAISDQAAENTAKRRRTLPIRFAGTTMPDAMGGR